MKACLYSTDPIWLSTIQSLGVTGSVNFWRRDFRQVTILPGDALYFKIRGQKKVGGRAYFREQRTLSIKDAWSEFQKGNGATSERALREMIRVVLGPDIDPINCLVLDGLEVLPEAAWPSLQPEDFKHGLVNYRYFEVGQLPHVEGSFAAGAELPSLAAGIAAASDDFEFDPLSISSARTRALRTIAVRRGQRAFREMLLRLYANCCCVTGEDAPFVLEAAHIHPYLGSDTNHPTNGLLLRSDWHTLFDLGLWTIDASYRIVTSSRLASTSFAAFHGESIRLPSGRTDYPSRKALRFHRDNVFDA